MASTRTIVAIMENCQQADGSIRLPAPLIPYMGGQTDIRPRQTEAGTPAPST
jgi:seryl-tRNA synthetase